MKPEPVMSCPPISKGRHSDYQAIKHMVKAILYNKPREDAKESKRKAKITP